MSDKRIDLTQFERMIDGGTWSIEWLYGDPENEEPSAAINTEDYGTIAQTFYRDGDEESDATTKAIAKLPDLIAELKRCYEYMDSMNEELTNWGRVIEIFDPHASYPELSAAFNEVFGD